jgi:hypothetical protein
MFDGGFYSMSCQTGPESLAKTGRASAQLMRPTFQVRYTCSRGDSQ